MARIYREHPDSSYLLAPRIFTRVFCQPGQLIETVRFYQELTQERLDMDMDIPEAGLHVVAEIVQERWEAPVGAGTRLRHPDGLIVEYLEHRPTNDDVPTP